MEPQRLEVPDPMTGCVLDHKTIDTNLLLGDGGLRWVRCPFCNVMVEGALATGEVTGPAYGPGRGEWVARKLDRLVAWTGWSDFLDRKAAAEEATLDL